MSVAIAAVAILLTQAGGVEVAETSGAAAFKGVAAVVALGAGAAANSNALQSAVAA
ncbi:hypothetical protein [Rhodoblastus acidophilus]|uniref:hypothetical protein n=1 Tax=Rhodoblastus acidophilus TaxID=1074 RepID=UPI001FF0716B|nr:hypothetical protein [Rhodoblastus acidophilus]